MRNIKQILALSLFLLIVANVNAQKIVKLWNGNPPTNNEITKQEHYNKENGWVTDVTSPEIAIYSPDNTKNNGMAVIICAGGGYAGLAYDHEGVQFAKWLNEQSITGIVLKYRMPNKHKEIPLSDAQEAIRYIRGHAKEFGIKENKIGIAGFSAGGHLAATASTHFSTNGISTRPDFSILVYPVITMDVATHMGSRINLLGDNPSMADIDMFSNEKQVNVNTPPAILLLSDDDKVVLPINSISYYEALKNNDIPATMYIFPNGNHGWGMNKAYQYHNQMLTLLQMWLIDIENK